ncbi:hypothetical protein MMC11_000056 [Xylographa trunciseda]|nr:hypothetical protein [Xylographa trunciseda]
MVPTEIVEVSVVVLDGTGMIATTEIVEIRVVVACDNASELVIVGIGTGEREVLRIGDVVDDEEEEEEEEEEEDKVEVGKGIKLTTELDRLDVDVGLEDVTVVEALVEVGVLLVALMIGCGVGSVRVIVENAVVTTTGTAVFSEPFWETERKRKALPCGKHADSCAKINATSANDSDPIFKDERAGSTDGKRVWKNVEEGTRAAKVFMKEIHQSYQPERTSITR